jgi:hypothetical protein
MTSSASAGPIYCRVSRSSGKYPPCEDAQQRVFTIKYENPREHDVTYWTISFDSAADLLAWIGRVDDGPVIVAVCAECMVSHDGGPVPTLDLEIYNDYRE